MNGRFTGMLTAALLAWLWAAAPLLAHHSFAAEFDIDKSITLAGNVTKVLWTNPHVYIFIDVKNDKEEVTNWGFELGGPNSLLRAGWTRDAVRIGDLVTIDGYRAKDGSNLASARSIKLPDGRKLSTASLAGAGNPTK
jgi:hypothetical protein